MRKLILLFISALFFQSLYSQSEKIELPKGLDFPQIIAKVSINGEGSPCNSSETFRYELKFGPTDGFNTFARTYQAITGIPVKLANLTWDIKVTNGHIVGSNILKRYWNSSSTGIYYTRTDGVPKEKYIDIIWNDPTKVTGNIHVGCEAIAFTAVVVGGVPVPVGAPSNPDKLKNVTIRPPYKPEEISLPNPAYVNDHHPVSISGEGITECVWETLLESSSVSGNGANATYYSPNVICDDYECFDEMRVKAGNVCGFSEFSDWHQFLYNEIISQNGIEGPSACYNDKAYKWNIFANGYNDTYTFDWYYITHTGGQQHIGNGMGIFFQIPGYAGQNGTIMVRISDPAGHQKTYEKDITNLGSSSTPPPPLKVNIEAPSIVPTHTYFDAYANVQNVDNPSDCEYQWSNTSDDAQTVTYYFSKPFTINVTVTAPDGRVAYDSHLVTPASPKSTNEELGTIELITKDGIYPNPSNGKFTISNTLINEFEHIKVYNISGQVITEFNLNQSNNIFELSKQGLYIIELSNETNVKIEKVIVK